MGNRGQPISYKWLIERGLQDIHVTDPRCKTITKNMKYSGTVIIKCRSGVELGEVEGGQDDVVANSLPGCMEEGASLCVIGVSVWFRLLD